MRVDAVFLVVATTVLSVASVPRLRQAWRGERPFLVAVVPLVRRPGNTARQARAGVSVLVSCYVLCLLSWLFLLSDTYDVTWLNALTGSILLLLLVMPAVVVATYAFGRPRWLIPRGLRSNTSA